MSPLHLTRDLADSMPCVPAEGAALAGLGEVARQKGQGLGLSQQRSFGTGCWWEELGAPLELPAEAGRCWGIQLYLRLGLVLRVVVVKLPGIKMGWSGVCRGVMGDGQAGVVGWMEPPVTPRLEELEEAPEDVRRG